MKNEKQLFKSINSVNDAIIKKQAEIIEDNQLQRFNEWMRAMGNIHYYDNNAMLRAYDKITENVINDIKVNYEIINNK